MRTILTVAACAVMLSTAAFAAEDKPPTTADLAVEACKQALAEQQPNCAVTFVAIRESVFFIALTTAFPAPDELSDRVAHAMTKGMFAPKAGEDKK
jgi:hypothetical protein